MDEDSRLNICSDCGNAMESTDDSYYCDLCFLNHPEDLPVCPMPPAGKLIGYYGPILTWTTDAPTELGWYWIESPYGLKSIIEVYRCLAGKGNPLFVVLAPKRRGARMICVDVADRAFVKRWSKSLIPEPVEPEGAEEGKEQK